MPISHSIVQTFFKPLDSRLGRHINHDSRSRKFAFPTKGLTIQSVIHNRNIPILNQGNIGSCTAETGIGALSTDPIFKALPATQKYPLTQPGAYALYNDEENYDSDGHFPPADNGSSGLTMAHCLYSAGLIAGYQHTFSLNDALLALSVTPLCCGTNWYSDMFNPDPDGRVHPTGTVAGGHEYLCRQYDAVKDVLWFDNSWDITWGIQGRFYMTSADFGTLLVQQGDVTILLPFGSAAPTPAEPDDPVVEQ